jgi:hypothetical protein
VKKFRITVLSERQNADGSGSLRFSHTERIDATQYLVSDGYLNILTKGDIVATYAPHGWCAIVEIQEVPE